MNIDYTLWPNAGGTLGQIKVQIPTGDANDPWPEGDALVHNFVYQNGKLVGFVDTKALILNESATTTFPYDYVDISLPSIQEGTLTINRGERCKYLNVKMYRADWLPDGFTELEYLESSGTQYFLLDYQFTTNSGISADVQLTDSRLTQNNYYLYFYNLLFNINDRLYVGLNGAANYIHNDEYGNHGSLLKAYSSDGRYSFKYNYKNSKEKVLTTSEGTKTQATTANYVKGSTKFPLFTLWREVEQTSSPYSHSQRVYSLQFTQGDVITKDLVPVLNAEGEAGLYDKINKTFIPNTGSGTFGYRIKFTNNDIAPLSLRDPYYVAPSGVYAKLIGENQLEIVADTEEVHGDDYVRFDSAIEAYEHFNVALPNVE